MGEKMMRRPELFLDTAYALALSVPNDAHHAKAVLLSESLEREEARLITTQAVVLEIGNALAKLRYRKAAIELLESLESDPDVEIVLATRLILIHVMAG